MSHLLNRLFMGKYQEDIFLAANPIKKDPFWIPELGTTHADPRYQEINLDSPFGYIAYIISGKGVITHNEKIYTVRPGNTYLLKPGDDFNLYSDCIEPMEKIWFRFEGSLASDIIKAYRLAKIAMFENIDTYALIHQIQKEARSDEAQKSIQNTTLITFMRIIQHLQANKASKSLDGIPIAESVKLFIDYHLLDNPSINYIAEFYNKSARYVITTFRRRYQITPYQYFIREKAKLCAAIITSTHQPYRIISDMLHITDDDTFKKHFEATYGLPPTEYHEQKLREAIDNMSAKNLNQN